MRKIEKMSKTLKWGIIAPGNIAHKFASDLKLVPHAELYAIASRSAARSKEFANKFGAKVHYNSYESIVSDPNVDVIYIASPHTFHYEQTMLCLKNNKHVLCEKPMGMNADEVKKMALLAKTNGLFLMEAFWTRFIPSFKRCLELINNKTIGDIHSINANFGFSAKNDINGRLLNKQLGGGALLDIGLYPVFLALTIMGKPTAIKASGVIGPTGVDLNNSMIFEYQNKNCIASLNSTINAFTPTDAIISGSKGYIRLQGPWHCPTSIEITINGETKTETFDEQGFGYEHEATEVTNCILSGSTESQLFTFENSLLLHNTLDAIREQINLRY